MIFKDSLAEDVAVMTPPELASFVKECRIKVNDTIMEEAWKNMVSRSKSDIALYWGLAILTLTDNYTIAKIVNNQMNNNKAGEVEKKLRMLIPQVHFLIKEKRRYGHWESLINQYTLLFQEVKGKAELYEIDTACFRRKFIHKVGDDYTAMLNHHRAVMRRKDTDTDFGNMGQSLLAMMKIEAYILGFMPPVGDKLEEKRESVHVA